MTSHGTFKDSVSLCAGEVSRGPFLWGGGENEIKQRMCQAQQSKEKIAISHCVSASRMIPSATTSAAGTGTTGQQGGEGGVGGGCIVHEGLGPNGTQMPWGGAWPRSCSHSGVRKGFQAKRHSQTCLSAIPFDLMFHTPQKRRLGLLLIATAHLRMNSPRCPLVA